MVSLSMLRLGLVFCEFLSSSARRARCIRAISIGRRGPWQGDGHGGSPLLIFRTRCDALRLGRCERHSYLVFLLSAGDFDDTQISSLLFIKSSIFANFPALKPPQGVSSSFTNLNSLATANHHSMCNLYGLHDCFRGSALVLQSLD